MRLSLNNIPSSVFTVNAAETEDKNQARADIISMGRLLAYEYGRKGQSALCKAIGADGASSVEMLTSKQYKEMNEKFQHELCMFAAKKVSEYNGTNCPETFDDFKRMGMNYYTNSHFYAVLQGIFQEIVTPILPRVYSEAVSVFADVEEVGFGETYMQTIESNDIPIFQDSAWGASRSVSKNRFYSRDITVNPQPKTAAIFMKWHQLVGNNVDFGKFFANLTAGLYAKTMGMWSQIMATAASDTSLVPSGFTYAFNATNWVALANKLSAVNAVGVNNLVAFGNLVALAKVLPTQSTGTTNVEMDAALATLLGRDYIETGYLGKYMGVKLMPLTDAIVPDTQNGNGTTVLDGQKIWMLATSGRKPLTLVYNSATPITIEFEPSKTADFEIGINLTIALEGVAVFASRTGLVTI